MFFCFVVKTKRFQNEFSKQKTFVLKIVLKKMPMTLQFKLFASRPVHQNVLYWPAFLPFCLGIFSPLNLYKGQTSTRALLYLYCTNLKIPQLAWWTKRRQVKLECWWVSGRVSNFMPEQVSFLENWAGNRNSGNFLWRKFLPKTRISSKF